MGSAALVAAVALPGYGNQTFLQGINESRVKGPSLFHLLQYEEDV